jgi:hypothetical protein
MKDLIKKFVMVDAKPVSTPMSTTTVLDPNEDGEAVNQREYRSMIGSLLYLTVTRSDIQFTVCSHLGLPTHFISSSSSMNFQVSQTNS